MASQRIIVIDDQRHVLDAVVALLQDEFNTYEVHGYTDPIQAVESVQSSGAELVLTDLSMPDVGGREVLESLREIDPGLPVVVLTGYGSVDLARELTRSGADDFITKPFRRSDLGLRLHLVLERRQLRRKVRRLEQELARSGGQPTMLGRSTVMQRLGSILPTMAVSEATVLIEGENGTGKELVAHMLHDLSARAEGPFVAVNCGALPETLIESELFGFTKGAFTGAHKDKQGMVQEASGGTLFLDEVGELPLAMQVKLLRFLQESVVRSVGDTQEVPVDVRVVAATNRNLGEMVGDGSFREDLYYRLRVLPVVVPPLRDRGGDVSLLAEHFLSGYRTELGRPDLVFDARALMALQSHDWPGNVRELQNLVQRLAILSPGPSITVSEVEQALHGDSESNHPLDLDLRMAADTVYTAARDELLERFERGYVARQLEDAGGNLAAAARASGLDRKSFWRILKRRGLDPSDYR